MQLHSEPLSNRFRFGACAVALFATVFALYCWIERSWQQWQIVRELEGQGIRIYLSGMSVPQEKRYSKLTDFPDPLPVDQGTWQDFSRHLFSGVKALDFTHYTGLNQDMTAFEPRLAELLDELPQVDTAVGWQGSCGCCLTVDWCPIKSKHGPIEHRAYAYDLHFRRELNSARREQLLAKKIQAARE